MNKKDMNVPVLWQRKFLNYKFNLPEMREVNRLLATADITSKDAEPTLEKILNRKMEEKTLMNKIFTPHELKTIEVDTEKKIFRINGEDFGEGCTGFTISCTPGEFEIRAEIDTTVEFANYSSKGELRERGTYKRN